MIELTGHNLTALLATYGYWAVFALVAVESMGVPVPGESTLVLASVYAGTTHRLSVLLVVAAAVAGAILGDNLGFLAGREGGHRLLHRYGRYIRMDERRLRLGQLLFERHGGKVVFFGRFVAVLRMWAAFLAGTHRMSWARFLAFNAAGALLWASLMGLGAYTFGDSVLQCGGPTAIIAFAVAALAAVAGAAALRRQEQRLQREADCREAGCIPICA